MVCGPCFTKHSLLGKGQPTFFFFFLHILEPGMAGHIIWAVGHVRGTMPRVISAATDCFVFKKRALLGVVVQEARQPRKADDREGS